MIKVSEPLLQGNEKKYLCQAIDEGEISSRGRFVREFEEAFAKWSGNKYAVAVCSGIAALETAIWAMEIKKLLIPDYTIISCAIACIRAGALPNFYEDQPMTGDMMRCHLFGDFSDYKGLEKIVDDSSQYWKPFKVKDIACYSLYANKLITSGEGGILITNNKETYDRARYYRDLCPSKEKFIHYDMGYNFRMSNIQAAVALAQLEQIDKFIEIKQRNRDMYLKCLPSEAEVLFDVEIPWMYLIKTKYNAGEIVKKLKERDIDCRRHFFPLDKQPCFTKFRLSSQWNFAISDDLWERAFYLPSGLTLTEKDIIHVCENLREVLRSLA